VTLQEDFNIFIVLDESTTVFMLYMNQRISKTKMSFYPL